MEIVQLGMTLLNIKLIKRPQEEDLALEAVHNKASEAEYDDI